MDLRIQAVGEAVDGFVYLTQLDWNAIDDRNRLSHVYDEREFREMLGRMASYAALFHGITRTLQEQSGTIDGRRA